MRLISFTSGNSGPRIGVRVGHRVLDIEAASRVDGEPLPNNLRALLREGRGAMSRVQALAKAAQSSAGRFAGAMVEERAIRFMPPVADAGRFVHVADNFPAKGTPGPRLVEADASRLAGHNAKAVARDAGGASYPQLVYVVGRPMKDVDPDDAVEHAWGVTLMGPGDALGPEIVTLDEIADLDDLWITCAVNGTEAMRFNMRDPTWKPGDVLARLSRNGGLEPGDLVGMGAPAAAVSLGAGDTVECAIEGVTTLRVVMGEGA